MSTTSRKARRRAGIKFERTPKTGTPLTERAWFTELVPGPKGTINEGKMVPRSVRKRAKAFAARSESITDTALFADVRAYLEEEVAA